ncbi:MAG TPA: tetratricopeptide repeat protein [Hyphomicrobiaceae bacterium]
MLKPAAIGTAILLLAAGSGQPASAIGELAAVKAQEAASALLRGNLDQAVASYTDALQDQTLPNDRRAAILNDRGVASSRLGKHKAAIDDFNRAVQLFPEYAPVYNNRGNTLLSLGLVEEAIKDFNRAIALAPGYAAAYNNRASAKLKLGEAEGAIEDYTQAVRLAPQNSAALTGRGQAYMQQDRPYSAMREFSRAITADSRSVPAYRARAHAEMQVGQYEQAIEDLSRAIAFEPENAELQIERGYAYRLADNAASALRDYSRALEIDPSNARALAGRGLMLTKLASFEEAEAELSRALEIDPRSAEAFAYRAWFYKQTGQPELGLPDVEKALKIDAGDADVHWVKGEVEQALGHTDIAIASLQKALSINPFHRDARMALQQMGVEPDAAEEVPAAAIDGWRVVSENGRLVAHLQGRSNLTVPLERAGAGEPRLLEWELKDGVLKGIGLLRYFAGAVEGPNGPEPIEQVAIVDVPASRVVSLQLHRRGDKESTWTWNEGTVTIESIDGVTDVLVLRDTTPREVADRRPARTRQDFWDGPSWAPWAQDRVYRERRAREPRRSRPPKTIFDFLFGN